MIQPVPWAAGSVLGSAVTTDAQHQILHNFNNVGLCVSNGGPQVISEEEN
jgi:hypothetical protein